MISNVRCFVTGLLKIIHCKQHRIESSWFNEQIQSFKQRLKLCIRSHHDKNYISI